MPTTAVPLARMSPLYRRRTKATAGSVRRAPALRGRLILWLGGAALAAGLYYGMPAFWNWKHTLSSSGGRYFLQRVVIPLPIFEQNDPRWGDDLLGPTTDPMGRDGCAVTSAAMVLSGYGADTDPQRLNRYLTTHGGYTPNGWLYWEKAAEVAPYRQVERAYEDLPSYALIDHNIQAGNPVIIRLTLRSGHTHFVVIVGKEGWDYLIQDPARGATWGVYPLKEITSRIEALRFYRIVAPTVTLPPVLVAANPAPAPAVPPATLPK